MYLFFRNYRVCCFEIFVIMILTLFLNTSDKKNSLIRNLKHGNLETKRKSLLKSEL